MARYNIFVPARKDSDLPDITMTVSASNWLVALKESLRKIGEQGDSLQNILCETGEDGSLRVADPSTKRIFIIKEMPESEVDLMFQEAEEKARKSREEAERAERARAEAMRRVEELRKIEEAEKAAKPDDLKKKRSEAQTSLQQAAKKAQEAALQAAEDATGIIGEIQIEEGKGDKGWDDLDDWYDGDSDFEEDPVDSVIAEMFLAMDSLYTMTEKEAAEKIMDQAMKYVASDAGSVFIVQMNSALQDLKIVSARGPIAAKIVGITVPRGKGIVGFSALKGVRFTVNNVQRNPNFYGKLDKEFGFQTRSLLCVPIVFEQRLYGVIEMVNKKGGEGWTGTDGNIIESLADMLGKVLANLYSRAAL